MRPLKKIDFEFWNDSVGPYSPVPDLILPSNPFARNALVEALRKDANYVEIFKVAQSRVNSRGRRFAIPRIFYR